MNKLLLYKVGKFLLARMAQIPYSSKFSTVKIFVIFVNWKNEEEIMWEFRQKCYCVLTLSIAILLPNLYILSSILHSNRCYKVVDPDTNTHWYSTGIGPLKSMWWEGHAVPLLCSGSLKVVEQIHKLIFSIPAHWLVLGYYYWKHM